MSQDNSIESTKKFFSFSYKFLENVDCGGESIKISTDDAKCTLNFSPYFYWYACLARALQNFAKSFRLLQRPLKDIPILCDF